MWKLIINKVSHSHRTKNAYCSVWDCKALIMNGLFLASSIFNPNFMQKGPAKGFPSYFDLSLYYHVNSLLWIVAVDIVKPKWAVQYCRSTTQITKKNCTKKKLFKMPATSKRGKRRERERESYQKYNNKRRSTPTSMFNNRISTPSVSQPRDIFLCEFINVVRKKGAKPRYKKYF